MKKLLTALLLLASFQTLSVTPIRVDLDGKHSVSGWSYSCGKNKTQAVNYLLGDVEYFLMQGTEYYYWGSSGGWSIFNEISGDSNLTVKYISKDITIINKNTAPAQHKNHSFTTFYCD